MIEKESDGKLFFLDVLILRQIQTTIYIYIYIINLFNFS